VFERGYLAVPKLDIVIINELPSPTAASNSD
jgi:hypothetical protein